MVLAGCQDAGGSSENRKVKEYLADRYEGVEFSEVSFSVWEGKIEESQDWNYSVIVKLA